MCYQDFSAGVEGAFEFIAAVFFHFAPAAVVSMACGPGFFACSAGFTFVASNAAAVVSEKISDHVLFDQKVKFQPSDIRDTVTGFVTDQILLTVFKLPGKAYGLSISVREFSRTGGR